MTLHEWDNDGQVAVAYPSPPLSPHQIHSPVGTSPSVPAGPWHQPSRDPYRDSAPLVVDRNICHFLWYGGVASEGLRSVGANGELPIQERVLYPALRSRLSGWGLWGFGPLVHRYW